ncbi:MAG: hypothetical protein AAGJ74_06385 [Pseudomonadota bacterium]
MSEALIVDPGLRSVAGHHYAAALALTDVLAARGVSVRVLGSRFATAGALEGAGARAVFTNNVYSRGPYSATKFETHVRATLDGLLASAGPDRRMPDLVILPTCDAALAEAVARFLSRAPEEARPPVLAWLLLSRDFARMSAPEGPQHPRRGYAALEAAVGADRLHVFTETQAMADVYRVEFMHPIAVAPSPAAPIERPLAEIDETDGPRFSAFGHIVDGKGYELFPDAIAAAAGSRPALRFTIHAAVNATSARKSADLLDAIEAAAPGVTVLREELNPARYATELARADAVMLPYDPRTYGDRGSGIYNECEAAGIPVLATAGCSFAASAIAGGRAVAIARHDAAALASAICDAAERIGDLRAAASAHAKTHAAERAAALNAIVDTALKQAPPNAGWRLRQGLGFWRARGFQSARALVRFPLMLRATRNARRIK